MAKAKPFNIPKREVWGSLQEGEGQPGSGWSRQDRRLPSLRLIFPTTSTGSGIACPQGSYFPPPVRRVDPSQGRWTDPAAGHSNGRRPGDRTGSRQTVSWSPSWRPIFRYDDSYGYHAPADRRSTPSRRPDSVAGDSTGCSILMSQSYFDSIDWERLLKAVRHHTDCPWALLYIERWLKAPRRNEGR